MYPGFAAAEPVTNDAGAVRDPNFYRLIFGIVKSERIPSLLECTHRPTTSSCEIFIVRIILLSNKKSQFVFLEKLNSALHLVRDRF